MDLKQSIKCTLLITLVPLLISTNTKNTCPTFLDYFLINFSSKCYNNPDIDLTVPQLIEKYTGNLKVYNVTTEDGYILTVFRIFQKIPKGVVFLPPPLTPDSRAWLLEGNESLAFRLWNMGYDVWLSNYRGTLYSRKHVNLTESDPEFWNFSFHEIALFDLEAQFRLIRNKTNNSKVIFIAYSMSGTTGLIYASLKPEEVKANVKAMILGAPGALMAHSTSPLKAIVYMTLPFKQYLELSESWTMEILRKLEQYVTVAPIIANIILSFTMGWTPNEMDPIFFPYIYAHLGRGLSKKVIYHYYQLSTNGGHFSMYDYGEEKNQEIYGSEKAPDYPLKKISTPVYIIYGDEDIIVPPQDMEMLCNDFLPKDQVRECISIPQMNHVNFLYGKHTKKRFHANIFNILMKIG